MKVKFETENEKFDPERYAFDNYDSDALESISLILSHKNTIE
jgi:hypothetical protein